MNVSSIQQLLAPVVMISACGLLCMGLYNRLSTIIARIRQFNRERLEHAIRQRGAADTVKRMLELHDDALEKQIPGMLHRARLIHRALLCLVACVIGMLVSSLLIGVAMLVPVVLNGAIAAFVFGVTSMLVGMMFAFRELTVSLSQVQLEAAALEELPEPTDEA
jgi:hypothetical protein